MDQSQRYGQRGTLPKVIPEGRPLDPAPHPLIYWGDLSVTGNGDLPLATQRRPLPGYRRCAKVKPSRVASQDSKNCNDGFPASRRTYWMAFRSCSSDCNCKPTLSERRSQVHGISQALTRLTWPPSRATARHRRSVPGHLMPLRSGAPHSTSPCARSAKTSQP